MTSSQPIWTPDAAEASLSTVARFMRFLGARAGRSFSSYGELHAFSVADRAAFWSALWDFCGVVGKRTDEVLTEDTMPGAIFFPGARLNFAENLLQRQDHATAIVFRGEDKEEARLSFADLHNLVSRIQQWLESLGVGPGHRVAAMMPNRPETVAAMLATAALGATWASCSPDFGARGVVDRFGQITPTVLFAVDGYWYAGKRIAVGDKVREIAAQLPSLKAVALVPYLGEAEDLADTIPNGIYLPEVLADFPSRAIRFPRFSFDHPLYILFSSGTTGVPKCIVHGAGGALLQHLKEHRLHFDIRAGDRVFYFTTCGWMMWNWLAAVLASDATIILYDGSPLHPSPNVLFDYAEDERVTLFGTSAKFIDSCHKAGIRPRDSYDLSTVRVIASTGSPLSPESFDYVYDAISPDAQLVSMSGGTDILGCFVLGEPTSPVWKGEIQAPGLGLAIEIWDDDGRPMTHGKGELVCAKAFPTMPLGFWNDPDGSRYRASYFERFPGVWCHGDFAEWTEHGGIVIHGRSDATLNPGGVRIGTAEIYAQLDRMPEVLEGIAIGQEWDNDVRVVLFVRLAEGARLDEDLQQAIRAAIRSGASPRHVPAKIIAVADIPRTKSGKITELAVRDVVHGRAVKNADSLANPEALDLFRDRPELRV
ncbi:MULTISPECIES: acetoacetate--CoA ligase [unclassified Chelatococcus]|uniref:acetoacetate--CoA ligase n=1 Tax=unclassified Chelatococcus TaxID=2638111 RepID=UPI001BCC52A3|nr:MULTISPECIES: acetoacetate--CoA ligase [unclassified Chelatococcus]CAH1673839.1 Acetoacetyl-coenzyme A synthetase [Hyphomicrobiales bacterium]MBS7738765.1 acetoacetate--CoA ligase [Chelatococcus sp. HY11]MBX3543169.1 acetoacetate--CoA ligase [Chelatococcus sp.]MCO5076705.1 acetoacetate--CoA ligase [Chelatococcus sp.]CAH1673918.1 Acetoacetyl-coenzyme A synthetase [Hyphomicrobiales bacterium]